MAKLLIIESDEDTRVPFLRGILTRSLQNAGLSFEEAYALASRIRDDLEDVPEITTLELRKKVAGHLEKKHDKVALDRYLAPYDPPATIQVRHRGGHTTPFSRAWHQLSLECTGLSADEAKLITTRVHRHLITTRNPEIATNQLSLLTHRFLEQDPKFGPDAARRYLVWVDFQRSGRPLVLLIGGTTGCGKSTIATELASRLDIVRAQSTDMLREVMRTMLPKRLLPILYKSAFNAWQDLPADEERVAGEADTLLADGYRTQADLLSVPCEAVVSRALAEQVSIILEGVHVYPPLFEKLLRDTDAVIVPIMLAVLKRDHLVTRIRGRGTKAPQRRYERYLKNFDSIWKLQSFLLSEADRAEIPIVTNDAKDKVIPEVMRIINDRLSQDFSSTPKQIFGYDPSSD